MDVCVVSILRRQMLKYAIREVMAPLSLRLPVFIVSIVIIQICCNAPGEIVISQRCGLARHKKKKKKNAGRIAQYTFPN